MRDVEYSDFKDRRIGAQDKLREAVDPVNETRYREQDSFFRDEQSQLDLMMRKIKDYLEEDHLQVKDEALINIMADAIDSHLAIQAQNIHFPHPSPGEMIEFTIPEDCCLSVQDLDRISWFVTMLSETEQFLADGLSHTGAQNMIDEVAFTQIKSQLHVLGKLKAAFLNDFHQMTKTRNGEVYFSAHHSEYVSEILELLQGIKNSHEGMYILEKNLLNAAGDDVLTRSVVTTLAVSLLKKIKR